MFHSFVFQLVHGVNVQLIPLKGLICPWKVGWTINHRQPDTCDHTDAVVLACVCGYWTVAICRGRSRKIENSKEQNESNIKTYTNTICSQFSPYRVVFKTRNSPWLYFLQHIIFSCNCRISNERVMVILVYRYEGGQNIYAYTMHYVHTSL